jgi:hypothetical protein
LNAPKIKLNPFLAAGPNNIKGRECGCSASSFSSSFRMGRCSFSSAGTSVFVFLVIIVLFDRTVYVDVISANNFALFICFFSWIFVALDGGGGGFWVQPLEGKLGGGDVTSDVVIIA